MLDVGAVAAKAGPPVPAEEEAAALVPAIAGLAGAGVPVSADTFSVEVARRALEAGAGAVNDISGGSEEMFELVAERGCGYVLMHIEGPPRVDRPPPRLRRRRRPPQGLVRGASRAGRGPGGRARSRSRSTPDSTSTSAPSRTSRSCGGSASCARSGCRSTSRSRARTSSAPCWPAPGRSGCRPASASGGRSPRWRWRCARAPTSSASTTAARCRRCAGVGRATRSGRTRRLMAEDAACSRRLGRSRSTRRGATGGSSPRASRRSASASRSRCRDSLDPAFAEALRGAGIERSTRTSARPGRRPPTRTW